MEGSIKIRAQVKEVGELEQIRRTTKPDMYKRLISLSTADGQLLYAEIRNSGLKTLDRSGIVEGTIVDVEISFQGSEKADGKKYNNILIRNITRV